MNAETLAGILKTLSQWHGKSRVVVELNGVEYDVENVTDEGWNGGDECRIRIVAKNELGLLDRRLKSSSRHES